MRIVIGLALLAALTTTTATKADPCRAIPDRGPMPSYLHRGAQFSGPVVYVGDGDSLCVAVGQGPANWVEIRLEDFYAPELHSPTGPAAKAGDRVQFSSSGTQPSVSAALGVTVYRVVQEGLTNFLKHAGPDAHATVTLIYQPTTISIEVADDGGSTPPRDEDAVPAEPGFGLQGMNERVTAMGGRLSARPGRGGGWVVRATLPLTGAVRTPMGTSIGNNGMNTDQDSEQS